MQNLYDMDIDGTGSIYALRGGTGQMLTTKYSTTGDSLWTAIFTGIHSPHADPEKIIIDQNYQITVLGVEGLMSGDYSILKVTYDTTGSPTDTAACLFHAVPSGCTADASGNVYVYAWVYDYPNLEISHIYSAKYDAEGNELWYATYGLNYGEEYPNAITADDQGSLFIAGFEFSPGYTDQRSILIKYCGNCNCIISGHIFDDLSGDCVMDTNDAGLSGHLVKAEPGTYYGMADSNGYYMIMVPPGTYTVTAVPDPYRSLLCPTAGFYTASVPDSGDMSPGNDFAMQTDVYCYNLEVYLGSGAFRSCMNTSFTVYYINTGTMDATNVQIEITFNPLIIPLSSTLPWSSQINDTYTFNIGTLQPGQSGSFVITAFVSCSALAGSTLCAAAYIFPDILCFPPDPAWDHSSVAVAGGCLGDSLACFTIYNTGDPGSGNMLNTCEYRIYSNNALVFTGQFQLAGGDSLIVCWPTGGNAIRLEADQPIGHPGNSHPKLTIELCGDSTGTSLGQIIIIPADDQDDDVDIICHEVTGSYDPNDKEVVPAGLTQNHYIKATAVLEYQINFQNTGTDTAFTIVIRDTLSPFLDASTAVNGASSHPCTFSISDQGLLEWRFDHVLLPDSSTNEPASHGFVSFTVQQMPSNAPGTLIVNSARIYFDFNDPVLTNAVWNIVHDTVLMPVPQHHQRMDYVNVSAFPNPLRDHITFIIDGKSAPIPFDLLITDALGRQVHKTVDIRETMFTVSNLRLAPGIYFYRLSENKEVIATGRLVMQ